MQPAFITALALVIAAPASAGTIFQSLPGLTVAPVVAGYCSSCNPFLQFRIYDSFSLASAATINSVTFAIDTSFNAGNSVNVGFFGRNGALPGASIASYDFTPAQFTGVTPLMTGERTRALVTVDIGSLALGAGDYAISFFNPAGLSIPAYANPGGSLYQSGNFFSPSTFYADRSAAFSLDSATAAVPEPASWAMMIIGFGLVGAARRRRVAVAA